MLVIGLDTGRANTGVVIFDIEEKKIIHAGTIKLEIKKMREVCEINPEYFRLHILYDCLESLINKYYPYNVIDKNKALCVIEDYAYGEIGMSLDDLRKIDRDALSVSEVHGVCYSLMAKYSIPIIKVAPTKLKYFITGDGKAEKTDMIKFLYEKYKTKINEYGSLTDDHQYDALGLVHFGRYFLIFCKDRSQIQEGTIAYNSVINTVYDQRFIKVAQLFGL